MVSLMDADRKAVVCNDGEEVRATLHPGAAILWHGLDYIGLSKMVRSTNGTLHATAKIINP